MSSIEIVVRVGGMTFAVSFAVNLMDDHQHKTGTEIFCLWRGELCSYLVINFNHPCFEVLLSSLDFYERYSTFVVQIVFRRDEI